MEFKIGNYQIIIRKVVAYDHVIDEALYWAFERESKLRAVKHIKNNFQMSLLQAKGIFDDMMMYTHNNKYEFFMSRNQARKHLEKELKKYTYISILD